MFVHLAKARRDKKGLDLDPAFHSLMETGTTKGYFHRASGHLSSFYFYLTFFSFQPWFELGNKLTETSFALTLAEKEVLHMLRLEVCFFLAT